MADQGQWNVRVKQCEVGPWPQTYQHCECCISLKICYIFTPALRVRCCGTAPKVADRSDTQHLNSHLCILLPMLGCWNSSMLFVIAHASLCTNELWKQAASLSVHCMLLRCNNKWHTLTRIDESRTSIQGQRIQPAASSWVLLWSLLQEIYLCHSWCCCLPRYWTSVLEGLLSQERFLMLGLRVHCSRMA